MLRVKPNLCLPCVGVNLGRWPAIKVPLVHLPEMIHQALLFSVPNEHGMVQSALSVRMLCQCLAPPAGPL